jgi:hypothetical protein
MSNIADAHRAVIARILDGGGRAAQDLRKQAFDDAGLAEPFRTLIEKVAKYANAITDGDVAAIRASGASEDEIFEMVVCGAIGQATRQYQCALAALEAAVSAARKD